jgi:hypothetical protein
MDGVQSTKVDTARARLLADSVFQYGKLFSVDSLKLEPAARVVARSLAISLLELGKASALRGDQVRTLYYLRRAYHLNPNEGLADLVRRAETEGVRGLFQP